MSETMSQTSGADDLPGRVKTSIYLPEPLYIRLKVQAAKERAPMTALILEALEALLKHRDPSEGISP